MPLWLFVSSIFVALVWTFANVGIRKLDIMLPHMWLRKRRLTRVLRDYPVYDPPHKVEERLLSRELAMENFNYFMSVRHARVSYLQNWLRKHFRVSMNLDRKGVKKLNRWGNKYAALLLDDNEYSWWPGTLLKGGACVRSSAPTNCYFTYDPAWTGPNRGCNVLFDMGIAMGEAMIAQCPNLHWALDKTEEFLPRTARMLKEDAGGTSFQRPQIYGYDNPICGKAPLHNIRSFAFQMQVNTMTVKDRVRLMGRTPWSRRNLFNQLISEFDATLRYYPVGNPSYSPDKMSFAEFAALIDQHNIEENEGHD